MAKAIMIQGTMSSAGKSLLSAGLCRIFLQDGYKVAPFKSQNMALNSYITSEGLEIGRAQAVQARAAKINPNADMNPILLKPTTDVGSQVIVRGVPIGNMQAREYFAFKKTLIPEIQEAYRRLDREYDIIVIEGAGSPAEINLNQDDIVNMGMARIAKAPVLLVGDIDRGGVFAQLYGTVMLLNRKDRQMVKGLIVNKFRGDKTILDPGLDMIEQLCNLPVTGVVPYMHVDIEEEDSLSQKLQNSVQKGLADIAVIQFPRISNFTDFNVFSCFPSVSLRYVSSAEKLGNPDLICLPGTKNTIDDLLWMRQNGLEAAILKLSARDVPIFGICGGYQMMGLSLQDSLNLEGSRQHGEVRGMGLLPVATVFEAEKTRTRVRGRFEPVAGLFGSLTGMELEGYEIHMGKTSPISEAIKDVAVKPFTRLTEYQLNSGMQKQDGYCNGRVYGTYVHGIFDGEGVAKAVVDAILKEKGCFLECLEEVDYAAYQEEQFDKLADGLRQGLDMEKIYQILEAGLSEI